MEKNKTKLVSVLMSVYGEKEEWLREAVDSILSQTYIKFEFIIILDKPDNDFLWEILKEYEKTDERIILVKNEQNVGLAASLNKGIEISKGEYIVRMDADDISVPRRIETLVEFMESNTEIGVCSSWMKGFGGTFWQNRIVKYPTKHNDLEINSLYQSPISHGATIIKRNVVDKYSPLYNTKCCRSQDYELWSRLMRNGIKFATIPKVLYMRRSSSNMGPLPIPYQVIHNQVSRRNIQDILSEFNLTLPEIVTKNDLLHLSKILESVRKRKDKKKLSTLLLLYYLSINWTPLNRMLSFFISGDFFKCIFQTPLSLFVRVFIFYPSKGLTVNNICDDFEMSIY